MPLNNQLSIYVNTNCNFDKNNYTFKTAFTFAVDMFTVKWKTVRNEKEGNLKSTQRTFTVFKNFFMDFINTLFFLI